MQLFKVLLSLSTHKKQLVKFRKSLSKKGNINGAIKLLTNNMQNGVLPLNEKTLELMRQKHPKVSPATESVLLKCTSSQI